MSTLVIQDTFAPYYAGRPGYVAPDTRNDLSRPDAEDETPRDSRERRAQTTEKSH